MQSDSKPILLGELLIRVGIVQPQQLIDAMHVAGETGLPIGRVLIMSGFMSHEQLQAAVQTQSLVKDKLLEVDIAIQALQKVCQEQIPLDQALAAFGWVKRKGYQTAKLGELLRGSDLVTDTQLDEALRTSHETGLPLGRVLVLTQAISDELLSAALTAQVLVRDGKITKEHAILGLKSAKRRRVTIEVSLTEHGFYRPPGRQSVKLGELFVLSGLVSEPDLMNALELGLMREMPIGQVLVESGYMTRVILDSALKLQEMVANGTLSAVDAAQTIRSVATKNCSIAQALAELNPEKVETPTGETIRLSDVLKAAGVVTEEELKKASEMSSQNSALVGKMLLVTGMIDEATLHASLRCQFLLKEGFLNLEQAIVALSHCRLNQVSFDDALQELGWTVATRMPHTPDQQSFPEA